MCSVCNKSKCCCRTNVITQRGPQGKDGKPGKNGKDGVDGVDGEDANITVKDDQGNTVLAVEELRFTDPTALVSEVSPGIAEIKFVPAATVWNDIQNLPHYVAGSESFKPQFTIEGNRISFRGLLYIPLENGGLPVDVANSNSYLGVPSVTLDETRMSIITNANTNNGTPQGRFFTSDIVAAKNLPGGAIPQTRDIVFDNVQAYRRYSSGRVSVYRSVVSLRIGALNTVFKNGLVNLGSGCLMVFSPFNSEYDGVGTAPLGNDPLGLVISRATGGVAATDYITGLDDAPFAVPASAAANPFDVNGHHITSLGGFIINLEGLTGYIN